jgi:transmembrane sensor
MKPEPSSPQPDRSVPAPAAATGASALDWARQGGLSEELIREVERQVRQRRRQRNALVATVAALAIAAAVWQSPHAPARLARTATPPVSAVVSLPPRQTLPDGTVVELKDDASIAVDFSGPLRRVTLVQGEALFHVAKNPQRPFVVSARGVEVRAVGTAFSVQLGNSAVDVLVTEGRVAIDHADNVATGADRRTVALVDAGNRVVVGVPPIPGMAVAPPVLAFTEDEREERLSWRVPRLEFSGTPLVEAVAMFNEHATGTPKVRLVLGDPSLEQLKLSGIIRATNTEALLHILSQEFGIKADRREGEIVLHR